MAEYEVKKLYNITTGDNGSSETYESLWAYYIHYPSTETNLPGRFRIRITRMTAEEFMAIMGMEESHQAGSGFSIQAYIEKWSDKGWQQCLDWIGTPDSSNEDIEADLLEMFKAFTTGQTANISTAVPSSPAPPPPPKPTKKSTPKPTLKVLKFPDSQKDLPKEDPTDLDWV